MAEENKDPRGRVVIPAKEERDIIVGGFTGNKMCLYRIFNGGQDGEAITVKNGNGTSNEHKLEWKGSIDVVVKAVNVSVKAGASKPARVSYDLIETIE